MRKNMPCTADMLISGNGGLFLAIRCRTCSSSVSSRRRAEKKRTHMCYLGRLDNAGRDVAGGELLLLFRQGPAEVGTVRHPAMRNEPKNCAPDSLHSFPPAAACEFSLFAPRGRARPSARR
jgi:hypothetical protein